MSECQNSILFKKNNKNFCFTAEEIMENKGDYYLLNDKTKIIHLKNIDIFLRENDIKKILENGNKIYNVVKHDIITVNNDYYAGCYSLYEPDSSKCSSSVNTFYKKTALRVHPDKTGSRDSFDFKVLYDCRNKLLDEKCVKPRQSGKINIQLYTISEVQSQNFGFEIKKEYDSDGNLVESVFKNNKLLSVTIYEIYEINDKYDKFPCKRKRIVYYDNGQKEKEIIFHKDCTYIKEYSHYDRNGRLLSRRNFEKSNKIQEK